MLGQEAVKAGVMELDLECGELGECLSKRLSRRAPGGRLPSLCLASQLRIHMVLTSRVIEEVNEEKWLSQHP